jgi:hypothetical protein
MLRTIMTSQGRFRTSVRKSLKTEVSCDGGEHHRQERVGDVGIDQFRACAEQAERSSRPDDVGTGIGGAGADLDSVEVYGFGLAEIEAVGGQILAGGVTDCSRWSSPAKREAIRPDQKGHQIGTPEGVPAAKLRQERWHPCRGAGRFTQQPVVFARQAPSTTGYKLSSLRDAAFRQA